MTFAVMAPRTLALADPALARLMPMHLRLGPDGWVRGAGPTLLRLCPGLARHGGMFSDWLEIFRPRRIQRVEEIARHLHVPLQVRLRQTPQTMLRGVAVPIADAAGDPAGGYLLNLSFGISVAEAVRDHALTEADFAPTDLTVEMLYLIEAKSAVSEELRGLTLRLEAARRAAERQSLTDPLTGLGNRRAFELALADAVRAEADGGAGFALLHLDLDFFKAVNDRLGHAAGDAVLARVAQVLRDGIRRQDFAARIGGDEFVLILRGATGARRIATLGRRIIAAIEVPLMLPEGCAEVSASIGAALSARYAAPVPARMQADADRALYASKHRGRGRCTLADPDVPPPEDRRRAEIG